MGEFSYEGEIKKWNIPEYYNIGYDCVDKHVGHGYGDKTILYWENADGLRESYTFGEMKDLTNKFGNILRDLGFKKGDRFLIRLPNIPTFIYDGCFNLERWFELLERYKITILASVPTAYRMFLTIRDAEEKYDLSNLRHCISAGESINPEVIKEWRRRFGLDIYDGIGMTEVMVYLSNMPGLKIKPESCGKPQPGKICAVVDGDGNPLPQGEHGVLAVKDTDPGLFKEYWRKPDKTRECFKNGWFLSGDVVYQDEEGYYWFSSRDDDLIMASGYRISPFEVESAIISHPDVLECAVVASSDEIRGVIVKTFIVLHDSSKASDELAREIQEHTKKVAAPYKYPREIEFVEELPKTQSGKIKRKELGELERKRKLGG